MNAALLTILLLPGADPDVAVSAFARDVKPFLEKHCYVCHDAKKAKAGFRIDELGTNFLAGKTADVWKEVIDQINSGAMPPKGEPRPDAKASFALVEWVGRELKRAEREARMAGGRNLLRRLNRDEYANTVGDLFGLDPKFLIKLREELPADGQADGFDRVAASLFFDQTQMEKYLAIAEMVAREAVQTTPPTAGTYVWQAEAFRRDPPKMGSLSAGGLKGSGKLIPTGPQVYKMRADGFEAWGASGNNRDDDEFVHIPAGPGPQLKDLVKVDGYYLVRVKGGGFPGERGTPIRLQLTYAVGTPIESKHVVEVKGSLEKPDVAEVLLFLRAGQEGQSAPLKVEWNGLADVRRKNPEVAPLLLKRLQLTGQRQKAIAARDEKEAERLKKELDTVLAKLDAFGGPEFVPNEKYDLVKVPRLFLDSIEVSGPIAKDWPPPSHKRLGLNDSLPQSIVGVRAVFERLLPQAYRRPVTADEIDRVVGLAAKALDKKATFHEAVRLGLQVVLTSPSFLYLAEPESAGTVRPLNDYELASRLSYFLWASMPDDQLVRLAAEGKLHNLETLKAQTTRMLADPKARRFVDGFAGQWLDVRQFGSVMPAKEYKAYDRELEVASKEEPLAFFQQMMNENLPITNFLDSGFLVVNERLARHYGIAGVNGPEFRKVAIKPEHHRGGVLGMAGLLTLLADGNRTLPVRRAAWVLEHLLNDPPPPPPPNAGDIQPNTSGKNLSVRDRLALHRNETTCASCHAKLDPYGLALENYDAIGTWREKQNGEGIRPAQAPKIDPSGALKSGRPFTSLDEYKAALLAEKDLFARAFVEKLLTFALCRPVGYVDRKTIDELVDSLRQNDYRIQTLLQAVVASEPFRTK
jgi:hypothetical protein